ARPEVFDEAWVLSTTAWNCCDPLSPLSCQPYRVKIGNTVQYNGFLSYSHLADANLAPAEQSTSHRFARSWYASGRCGFRDTTGLAVTPSLWEAVKNALADSEYFLLMASPEA